jgi:hypothetical protein
MTLAAKPLHRIAPCMPSQSCVNFIPQRIKTTFAGLTQKQIKDRIGNCSTVSSSCDNHHHPQKLLLNHEVTFNIHNPSLDHRDR